MEREAWNGAQEWMEENLELHGVDELWIQAERHQGLLLLHKQLLSASEKKARHSKVDSDVCVLEKFRCE
jgi:hypothetical protein